MRAGRVGTCLGVALVTTLAAIAIAAPASGATYPGIANVREAKGGKLSPRLLALTRAPLLSASANAQADGVDLPRSGGGSLLRAGARALLVYVRVASTSDATLGALRAAGLTPTHVAQSYSVVTGSIEPANLARLAAVARVEHVMEALRPQTSGAMARGATKAATAGSYQSCGSRTSEGARQLSADSARSAFGVDGSGVRVGILSDSYDVATGDATSAAQDVATGDIPGPGNPCGRTTPVTIVNEIDDPSGAIDEGRGMAQIVHDLAPGSPISFATAFDGFYEFADNIRALQTGGSKVIVDDIIYFAEPMFQKGPIDIAIADVVAAGAQYFTSAGNSNEIVGGNNVASYEAPAYRPTGCPAVFAGSSYLDCHDFNPTAGTDNGDNIVVASGGSFRTVMQWAQSWNAIGTDIDLYVLNAAGTSVLASSADNNFTSQLPFEFLTWGNSSGASTEVQIVLARWSGAPLPRVKFLFAGASGLSSVQYNVSSGGDVVGPTIWGHSGTPDGFSVAAVPYDNRFKTEDFSSRGPRTLYFAPADGTNPGAPLGSPDVLPVPHMAATDGGANTFFGSNVGGTWRFYGTSAAAPHAGAVAALMMERAPSLTRSGAFAAFQASGHAVPTGGGPTGAGVGLVDALGAVQNVVPFGYVRSFTTPAGAVPGNIQFGTTWMNQWATDWVKVPVGSYSLTGTAVEGFTPPSAVVANVTAGATSIVSLNYTTLGNLRVVLSPAVPSTITIDGVRVNDRGFYAPFPAGAHQVCFGPVAGYDPPPCQNVNVAANRAALTTVNATFTPNAGAPDETGVGYLRVAPLPAGQVPTTIFINGQQRNQWALDWMKLPPGSYTVAFSDVEGFRAPAPQVVNIVAGLTTVITPTFAVFGNLRVTTSPALPATLYVDGQPINDWLIWTPFPPGSHEVCFGYVAGRIAPACQTVNVPASRAGLLDIQGAYAVG